MTNCAIIHTSYTSIDPVDCNGCIMPEAHQGPHEFIDPDGTHWQWESDMECDCEHCSENDGDYCTEYWKKPSKPPAATNDC